MRQVVKPAHNFRPVSPVAVLREIAAAIPEDCRKNIVVIGSLAAGYHYFPEKGTQLVRTKDADCLLAPRVAAIPAGVAVTERLLSNDWTFRVDDRWPKPGTTDTPQDDLPAVRLNPPGESAAWFIELLAVPERPEDRSISHTRIHTKFGDFSLVSFGFLALANWEPILTDLGIYIARPEMMALANLLSHPQIGPETMGGLIEEREIKRSNKDLGRVLALALLAVQRDEDSLLKWPKQWESALRDRYPNEWRSLAENMGSGLRQLLASEDDLDEARHTCQWGLLASNPPTKTVLRIAGERLLQDARVPLERASRGAMESLPSTRKAPKPP
jgi:hypothetical protein